MKLNKFGFLNTVIFSGLLILFLSGCEGQGDKVEGERADTSSAPITDTSMTNKEDQESIPDLTGNWSGTFDQRNATMDITKQEGNEITGTMVVNYRQPLNKTFSGTLYPDENRITMEDLTQSRYMGRYEANLIETNNNDKKLDGTFTMTKDGKPYSFSFTKK